MLNLLLTVEAGFFLSACTLSNILSFGITECTSCFLPFTIWNLSVRNLKHSVLIQKCLPHTHTHTHTHEVWETYIWSASTQGQLTCILPADAELQLMEYNLCTPKPICSNIHLPHMKGTNHEIFMVLSVQFALLISGKQVWSYILPVKTTARVQSHLNSLSWDYKF
jgi:hypothetical protein